MKDPKIIITDNRQVYRVHRCWYLERRPVYIVGCVDEIRRSMVSVFAGLRKATQKASKSLNEFATAFNQIEDEKE